MNCFAESTVNFANELTARSCRSLSASGPLMNRSVMWCDWSSSAHDVRQDCCSLRQLLNSGATGKTVGLDCALRRYSTGLPASAMASARLCGPEVGDGDVMASPYEAPRPRPT